ncbi:MAG: Gfo/Idh/MocA family oxidoreductase [Planctomycetaceae bacterium]|jgi:predicted dehydrogenase|nr:Gfo/Idh/MocA family oxidoreductase [Planctomycetaceae bacterium]
MTKIQVSRRNFLQTAAVAAAPLVLPSALFGKDGETAPSNKITFGMMGVGGRAQHDLDKMINMPDTQLLAICDVQKNRREGTKNTWVKNGKVSENEVTLYRDFREMFARPDIDAVMVITGDRWHGHGAIYAAQAGKDVYVEKPCALSMDISRQIQNTMNRYGTVFQAGTQRRSLSNFITARDLVLSGKLGKIKRVYASLSPWGLNCRTDWLPAEPEPNKEELDWDMWLGPAPWRPFNKSYTNGGWRGFYDFDSGSQYHEWGAHTLDLIQWMINEDGSAPVEYWLPGSKGDESIHRYAPGNPVGVSEGIELVMRTVQRGWLGLGTCPVRVEGENGWIETGDSGRIEVSPASLRSELVLDPTIYNNRKTEQGTNAYKNVRNWVDCIKTRAKTIANADVMASSHVATHAAAISYMLKKQLKFDPKTDTFIGDETANRMRTRSWREPWSV